MRPDDHHVEPFLVGLGHRHEGDGGPRGNQPAPRRISDPALKWKVLGVAVYLVVLALLISKQAF